MYHSVKSSLPEWFDAWNPFDPTLQEFLKSGLVLPLPGYDKKGRSVTLIRVGRMNPVIGTVNDFWRGVWMVQTLANFDGDEQTSIQGFVDIIDFADCGLQHVSMNDFSILKKVATVTESLPVKPKVEHVLNLPRLMESVNNIFQRLKKQKMRDRSQTHAAGDLKKLHEDVGRDILPVEYGGTNGTIEDLIHYWRRRAEDAKEDLIKLNNYKTNEAKRPGKPKLHADIFGIEGSFRKLEID